MAFEAPSQLQGNFNPSSPHPDTPYASEPSDLTDSIHPSTHLPEQPDHQHRDQRPRLPSLSVRSRTTSSASTTSTSSVRRKPLPLTASPLATRYSLGDSLTSTTTTLELPETFIRPYSVDSPTLYDFPPTPANPFTPAARFSREQISTPYVCSLPLKHFCFNAHCSSCEQVSKQRSGCFDYNPRTIRANRRFSNNRTQQSEPHCSSTNTITTRSPLDKAC